MITSGHDPWNACYGGELCMLAAITQHLVADSAGHTGGGRPHEYITHTLSTSHQPSYFNTFLICSRGNEWPCVWVWREERWNEICQPSLAFGHYVSSVCGQGRREGETTGEQLQRFVWVMSVSGGLGRRQYAAGSGSLSDKSQGSPERLG